MPAHWKKILGIVVASQLVVALLTGVTVYAAWHHLNGNITSGGAIPKLVPGNPTHLNGGPTGPLNILVLGLDTRDCAGCHIDDEPGGDGSDTTILVHISADRKTVYGISIPRDALVQPVPCTEDDHYVRYGVDTGLVEWNSAYTVGGAPCTAEEVEKAFGVDVPVDHFLTINFGGFKDMVDKIDGVDVCIPEDLDDPKYEKFDFKANPSYHLTGTTALKYVRLRHVLDGSDTGRIKRQQYFISQLIQKVESAGTLSRPDRLYGFMNALTKSLTTDDDLANAGALAKLAWQLRDIDLAHIKFISLPTQNYPQPPGNPYYGRVQVLQPATKALLEQVAKDQPLGSYGKGAQSAGGTPPKHPTQEAQTAAAQAGLCS